MKSERLKINVLKVILIFAFNLAGCSGGGGGNGGCPDFAIDPINPVISQGQTQQFTVYVYFNGTRIGTLPPNTLLWNSTDTTVAAINPLGLVTSLSTGTSNIIAQYTPSCTGINWTMTVLTVQ